MNRIVIKYINVKNISKTGCKLCQLLFFYFSLRSNQFTIVHIQIINDMPVEDSLFFFIQHTLKIVCSMLLIFFYINNINVTCVFKIYLLYIQYTYKFKDDFYFKIYLNILKNMTSNFLDLSTKNSKINPF